MKLRDKFELDQLLSHNLIGKVCIDNPYFPGIWASNEHDYIAITAPCHCKDRFDAFWDSAKKVLGGHLKVYHEQHAHFGGNIVQSWYFIDIRGAFGLLLRFNEIMRETVFGQERS